MTIHQSDIGNPPPIVSIVSTIMTTRKINLFQRGIVPVTFFVFLAVVTNIRNVHTTFLLQLVPTTSVPPTTMQSTSSCVGLNSQEWLHGPRYSNIALNDEDDDNDNNTRSHSNHHHRQQQLVLQIQDVFESSDQVQQLLFQTLCPKESRFTTFLLNNETTEANERLRESEESSSSVIRLWSVRLTYLALYYHQHRFALPEAQTRRRLQQHSTNNNSSSCQSDLDKYHIGPFDYECPHAKYLIISPGGNGIGANVRASFVVALLLGLALDRIVIFPSHVAAIRRDSSNFTSPLTRSYPNYESAHRHNSTHDNADDDGGWMLASCPRRDYQCFFRPTTPCTLTLEDVQNAYVLTKGENRKLRRYFEFPKEHFNTKVVQFSSPMLITKNTPLVVRQRLHTYALTLLKSVPKNDPRLLLMKKGADSILNDDELYNTNHKTKQKNERRRTTNQKKSTTTAYNYRDEYVRIHRALMFYAMRPNPLNAQKMDTILSEILLSNFTSATSIGLPIRGSDKCVSESECLTFHQHMQVASQMWSDYVSSNPYQQPQKQRRLLLRNVTLQALDTHTTTMAGSTPITATTGTPSIIFTTESRYIRQSQQDFVSNVSQQQDFPYQFQFITNPKDVTPDSGFMKHILLRKQQQKARPKKTKDDDDASADDIMLSAMTSLKLQLMPRLSIGNCCSNFHVLIQDYLMEGGGAARGGNTFMCLHENPNVTLRVCCKWSKECHKEKADYMETIANS